MAESSINKLPEPQCEIDRESLRDVACDSPDASASRLPPVVFVDLGGSLIATDVLIERF